MHFKSALMNKLNKKCISADHVGSQINYKYVHKYNGFYFQRDVNLHYEHKICCFFLQRLDDFSNVANYITYKRLMKK